MHRHRFYCRTYLGLDNLNTFLGNQVFLSGCCYQSIDLLLSITQMWNLARKGSGFESENILIIMSCGLMYTEKIEDGVQVTRTAKNRE